MDPYETLGVARKATKKQITKAFRRRAMETHPDRRGDPAEFRQVHQAYRILSDEARRKKYDQTGTIDEEAPDNSLAHALELLLQIFNTVAEGLIGQGRDPRREDLVAYMQNFIRRVFMEADKARDMIRRHKAFCAEAAKRFEVKEGRNYLAEGLLFQVGAADKRLEGIDLDCKQHQAALDILKDYSFRVDGQTEGAQSSTRFLFRMLGGVG